MRPVQVSLDHATVKFGERTALENFSGTFAPGTVTALIGGDGAGKSTLLKVLAGLLTLHSGVGNGLPVERRSVGYQPAGTAVWNNLSVAENVHFVANTYGLSASQTRTRADEALRRAGLDQVTNRVAGKLSGGMRRKLGVVLATLHQPGLVLLDEPTTGVDPISRAELWTLIAGAAADGATVVFATTYLDEAERANRLFLLGDGRLLTAGTPAEVASATPGTIWKAPIAQEPAGRELNSPDAWRRTDYVYRWQPEPNDVIPDCFAPAPYDLENTSIALQLSKRIGDGLVAGLTGVSGSKWTGTSAEPLVQANKVTQRYGSFTALDGVSLEVDSGEIMGLLGGNGAGKTTLMRILLGLETSTEGVASLFGRRPSLDSRRRIGYVTQGLGLYPSLSATENLEFAARLYEVSMTKQSRDFALALGQNPVAGLALGTKRILACLAATMHHPELLILDEPTSGMDALTRAHLWRDLRSLADQGTGILVTTHYMQEAAQCDRLMLLTAGEITAAGTVQEITATHTSLLVTTDHWDQAFALLRTAKIPALLDGRSLRIPGAEQKTVTAVLETLADKFTISETAATLEETMLLSMQGQAPA